MKKAKHTNTHDKKQQPKKSRKQKLATLLMLTFALIMLLSTVAGALVSI